MKQLRFMLGFVTGAIVVYLFLYRPVKQQQDKEDAALDEAMAMIDEYEATDPHIQRKRRLTTVPASSSGKSNRREDAS